MIESKKFFEAYLDEKKSILSRFKQPRTITLLLTTIVAFFLSIAFYNNAMARMSIEELENSLQIIWNDSQWVDKEINAEGVKIVPAIRLKIKNIGERPLAHINFVGVFNFLESGKRVGDGYAYVFDEPLKPGEISKEIYIKSGFGYTASEKSAFAENKEWKPVQVRIFAKTSSGFLELGRYHINHVIAGFKDTPGRP